VEGSGHVFGRSTGFEVRKMKGVGEELGEAAGVLEAKGKRVS
jgi:hypothetical protein